MDEFWLNELAQEEMTPAHQFLKDKVFHLVQLSGDHMSRQYAEWDKYDQLFSGEVCADEEDLKAKERKEPQKVVVPIGYSQVMAFKSFVKSLYLQDEFFFELVGFSPEDDKAADIAEALLQRDLDHNKMPIILDQFLLDVGKFGVGIVKCCWDRKVKQVQTAAPVEGVDPLTGQPTMSAAQVTEQVEWEGNKLMPVSPYRFYPDPRLSLTRFQEGEFVGYDETYTRTELTEMENSGMLAGTQHIKDMEMKGFRSKSRVVGTYWNAAEALAARNSTETLKTSVVITEIVVKLIPSQVVDGDGKKILGEETYPISFLLWMANDSRLVRVERYTYEHGMFPYVVGQYQPDQNKFMGGGLMQSIVHLQDIITWMINSRITNVRKVIGDRMVVDPESVEMEDVKNRNPVIRTKNGIGRSNGGVQKAIQQLPLNDVTTNHIQDAEFLMGYVEDTTGINENLQGQFNSGRRSAAEARNVMASASGRLKDVASNLFVTAMLDLGRQMLANLRAGLTTETMIRIFKSNNANVSWENFKKISPEDLEGNYDFVIEDATIPSQRGVEAAALTEFLGLILSNPLALQSIGLDPKLISYEILKLRGVKHPQRFDIAWNMAQEQQNGQVATAGIDPNAAGAQGQPGMGLFDGLMGAGTQAPAAPSF
jgi:hypothetical protein